jgi:hypothetical protein
LKFSLFLFCQFGANRFLTHGSPRWLPKFISFHFESDCVKYYIMLSIKVFWKEKMVHIPRVMTVKWRQTNFAAFLSLSLLGNVFKNLYNFSLILSKKKSCHYITVYNKLYLFLGFLFLNWWD